MPVELAIATFADRVGERFGAAPREGEPIELVLSACDASRHAGADPSRQPFSLTFHAGGGEHVPQQIFSLSHPELDEFALFLVPLGPDGGGMAYEAVIN
jgi:hypothetical protein